MIIAVLSALPGIMPEVVAIFKAIATFFQNTSGDNQAQVASIANTASEVALSVEKALPTVLDYAKTLYNVTDQSLAKFVYVRDQLMKDLNLDAHTASSHTQFAVVAMKIADGTAKVA